MSSDRSGTIGATGAAGSSTSSIGDTVDGDASTVTTRDLCICIGRCTCRLQPVRRGARSYRKRK